MVLFKNLRDIHQIQLLGRQTGMNHMLTEAYQDCMKEPFGYLVIDLSPHSRCECKLMSHIFTHEEDKVGYLPL